MGYIRPAERELNSRGNYRVWHTYRASPPRWSIVVDRVPDRSTSILFTVDIRYWHKTHNLNIEVKMGRTRVGIYNWPKAWGTRQRQRPDE